MQPITAGGGERRRVASSLLGAIRNLQHTLSGVGTNPVASSGQAQAQGAGNLAPNAAAGGAQVASGSIPYSAAQMLEMVQALQLQSVALLGATGE